MKRAIISVLCIVLALIMCGCSLDYSEQADDGRFSYAYGKKTAFVTGYRWDGTEEDMTVVIPEEYAGRKIVSVGGYFGRGLPMPFSIDISGHFPKDVQWVTGAEGADETVELSFTLVLPKGMDEIHIGDSKWTADEGGKLIEYKVRINIEHAG